MLFTPVAETVGRFIEMILRPTIFDLLCAAAMIILFNLPIKWPAVTWRLLAATGLLWASLVVWRTVLVDAPAPRTTGLRMSGLIVAWLMSFSAWLLIIGAAFTQRQFAPVTLQQRFRLTHLLLAVTLVAIFVGYFQYFELANSFVAWGTQLRRPSGYIRLSYFVLYTTAGTVAVWKRPQPTRVYALMSAGCFIKAIVSLSIMPLPRSMSQLVGVAGWAFIIAAVLIDRPTKRNQPTGSSTSEPPTDEKSADRAQYSVVL